MIDGCEVCDTLKVNDDTYLLYENDSWRVVLRDDDQEYLGKCIVVSKSHIEMLSEMNQEKWLDFADVTKWLEERIRHSFHPTHFNWQCLMNIGASQGVTHVHWHCVPRYKDTVKFAGEIFQDKRWPKSCRPMEEHTQVGTNILKQIADDIRG